MSIKKTAKVQKSNELNQANFSDFNLSCYRVLLKLVSQIQRSDDGLQLSLIDVSRYCSLSVVDYANTFEIKPDNAYAILKEATDKLMKTSFSLIQQNGDILKINVCAQAYYRKSQGRIDIEFTSNIMPHLAQLENNFTMYNLNEIAGFSSIYTTRFYELLMQFKITGRLEVNVKDLRFKLGCVDIFQKYNDFKRKTFGHAVDEINSQWKLNITYEEIKTSRAVTNLKFTFKKTLQHKAYDSVREKMRTQLIRPGRIKKEEIK